MTKHHIINKINRIRAFSSFFLLFSAILFSQEKFKQTSQEFIQSVTYDLQQGKFDEAQDKLDQEENRLMAYHKPSALTQLYFLRSRYNYYTQNLPLFEKYARKSYESGQKASDPYVRAYGLYAMAYYTFTERNYKRSYELTQEIINSIDLEKDPFLTSNVYYRLYATYTQWDDLEKTDFYTKKLISIANKLEDKHALADAYLARSIVMDNYFYNEHNIAYEDSTLYYLQEAVNLDKKFPNEIGMPTKSIVYLNLANLYSLRLEDNAIPFAQAKDSVLKYTQLASEVLPSFDFNYGIRGNVLNLKAQLYVKEGQLDKAETLLLDALNKLESANGNKNLYALQNVNKVIYKFYKSTGKHDKAVLYLEKSTTYKDSIFDENKMNQIADLEAKYDTERIKSRNQLLEHENYWSKTFNYLLIAIFLLIVIAVFYIRKNHIKKNTLAKLREKSLIEGKAIAEAETNLTKEKQSRLVVEQKIMRLEKEKLQKEALANSLQIERKNDLLSAIEDKISNKDNLNEVRKSLRKENRIDKSVSNSITEFKDIPHEFFDKLNNHSGQKLSSLDLKYCAYFLLGLDTKEIAIAFNVEPKSVRMKKYRIKQKLNISKDQTLEYFLISL